MKHTPTPWEVKELNNGKDLQIDSKRLHICTITRYGNSVGSHEKENAKFIVKAVNNHETLLIELKYALVLINDEYCAHDDQDKCGYCVTIKEAIKQAESEEQ